MIIAWIVNNNDDQTVIQMKATYKGEGSKQVLELNQIREVKESRPKKEMLLSLELLSLVLGSETLGILVVEVSLRMTSQLTRMDRQQSYKVDCLWISHNT